MVNFSNVVKYVLRHLAQVCESIVEGVFLGRCAGLGEESNGFFKLLNGCLVSVVIHDLFLSFSVSQQGV